MILFLDFDGVLHPEFIPGESPGRYRVNQEHFSCLPQFEAILLEFAELRVVISSTWRLRRSLEDLRLFFSPELRYRIVGATPELTNIACGRRQREIEAWMADNAPGECWIAVDDWPPLFDQVCDNVFFTETLTGLDHEAAYRLKQWINERMKAL